MEHKITKQQLYSHMAGNPQVKWADSGAVFKVAVCDNIDFKRMLYPFDTLLYTLETYNKCGWVLLLNRMGELVKSIEVIEEIYNRSGLAGGYDVETTSGKVIISQRAKDVPMDDLVVYLQKPQCNMAWINDILLEYDFDVYLLIDKGLAEVLKR